MSKVEDELAVKREETAKAVSGPRRLAPALLERVVAAKAEKEKHMVSANVAVAKFKLAEAEVDAIHYEIAKEYGLKPTDRYDDVTGEITIAPPQPRQ